ncbi:MAG: MoxR family ATPase [Gemmatimonadetes bacterium]|nr:MoxR family ATPase [Gemmatimonadota bacterium]
MSDHPHRSPVSQQTQTDQRDLELLARLAKARGEIAAQIGQRIVGQHEIVDNMISAILGGGHVLLVGVPGLAKTLLIQTIAQALDMEFSRIQFTPDLMPSDITGTELLEEDHGTGKRSFIFSKGPVFGNIVLADEINRAPPKTQAALLQAMQEKTVTVAGKTYVLPDPFFVLATQNPIEQEGTYHLPEAQLDRFMYELRMGYPSVDEEEMIVSSTTGVMKGDVKPVLPAETIREMQRLVRRIPAPPSLVSYAVGLARATRPDDPSATALVKKYVSFGAGPRAGQNLVLGAKSRAAMDGRSVPDLEDVDAVAFSVLRHRVVMNFQAEAEGVGIEKVLALGGRGRKG